MAKGFKKKDAPAPAPAKRQKAYKGDCGHKPKVPYCPYSLDEFPGGYAGQWVYSPGARRMVALVV